MGSPANGHRSRSRPPRLGGLPFPAGRRCLRPKPLDEARRQHSPSSSYTPISLLALAAPSRARPATMSFRHRCHRPMRQSADCPSDRLYPSGEVKWIALVAMSCPMGAEIFCRRDGATMSSPRTSSEGPPRPLSDASFSHIGEGETLMPLFVGSSPVLPRAKSRNVSDSCRMSVCDAASGQSVSPPIPSAVADCERCSGAQASPAPVPWLKPRRSPASLSAFIGCMAPSDCTSAAQER